MTGRFITGAFIRDLQVAEDVSDRARLGWFDTEFNFYGTAFVKNGEEYYLISADPVRIYDYIYNALSENLYCTPVESYIKKCSVPSGTEDNMAKDLKILLGKKLREKYPREFLQEFQERFEGIGYEDIAKGILDQFQNDIDGLFDEELLKQFQILVEQAYHERKLTKYAYQNYQRWIKEVQADMDDDLIVKDIYHKTMYCLWYEDNEKWKPMVNSQKDRLYAKQFEMMKKGKRILPIYGRTYWYNTDYRLSDVREDFKNYLNSNLMKCFVELAISIERLPGGLGSEEYRKQAENQVKKYGNKIKDYLIYYNNLWGCCRWKNE